MSDLNQEENVLKATTTAMFAAIVAAAAPGAYAQTSAMPATRAAVTSHIIQSDEVRASKMIGSTVYDLQNRDIGKVKDLVLNKDGAVDVVVLDVARSSVWAANTSAYRSGTSRPTITV